MILEETEIPAILFKVVEIHRLKKKISSKGDMFQLALKIILC